MKSKFFLFFFVLGLLLKFARVANAAPGDVDLSFDPGSGVNGIVDALAIQTDEKIVIGGRFTTVKGFVRNHIARLNSDGSPDATFNPGAGANNDVLSVAIQQDGKIIIAGYFSAVNGVHRTGIARLNSDGSLDASFTPTTGSFPYVHCVVLQPDGKVLIGGAFTWVNSTGFRGVARLNTDGTLDDNFDVGTGAGAGALGTYPYVYTIATQLDGKVIVGGAFTTMNGIPRARLARLNSNGSVDTSFTPNIGITNGYLRSIAVQADNNVIIGGWFQSTSGRNAIARLAANGSFDETFDPDLTDPSQYPAPSVSSVLLQTNGRMIVAGGFHTVNGAVRHGIVQLNPNGSVDFSFEPNTSFTLLEAVALQADGALVIAGSVGAMDGTWRNIARLNADGKIDSNFTPNDGLQSGIRSFAMQANEKILVAGGYFTSANNVRRIGIVRLNSDGTIDTNFNSSIGENSTVYTVALQPDQEAIIAGDLYLPNSDGTNHVGIARLHANGNIDTNFIPNVAPDQDPFAIVMQPNGKILIGGNVMILNSTKRRGIARFNVDGSMDTTFNSDLSPNSRARAIALQSDGKILIGGDFTNVNSASRNRIARLNADGSLDTSFDPGDGANASVLSILTQDNGKILIGGGFSTVDGTARAQVAKLLSDGSLDADFNPIAMRGFSDVPTIYSLLSWADKIIIAGDFTLSRGTNRNCIARLNSDGSLDTSFDPGPGADSRVFSAAIQSNGNVIIGGTFSAINGTARWRIARLFGDTAPVILSLTQNGEDVNLSWNTISNRIYRVQFSDDLSEGSWMNLPGDISATGDTASKTDTSSCSANQRFYRVLQLP